MALTVAVNTRNVIGNQQLRTATITFDDSYPTGGEALVPADLGLARVDSFVAVGAPLYNVIYDGSALLLAYDVSGVEVTAATDLATVVVEATVIGQ